MKDICFICGRCADVHRHHLIGGTANRRISDRYGLIVNLCLECHEQAHRDAELADKLHRYAERKWLDENGGTIEDFIQLFGRNYLI